MENKAPYEPDVSIDHYYLPATAVTGWPQRIADRLFGR